MPKRRRQVPHRDHSNAQICKLFQRAHNIKYYLVALAILTLSLPARAHTYKKSLVFETNKTIQNAQLKPGSYVLVADDTKDELRILQNGKVVATVQGQWLKLPKKSEYSAIVSSGDTISRLLFSGSDRALQLPFYTRPEYVAYSTARAMADPAEKIAALEAFITKYNNPTLMPFVYADMYQAYYAQKDYAKTIETIDKMLTLGDKVTPAQRLGALVNRAQAYNAAANLPAFQTPDMLTKTREASAKGIAALAEFKKPTNMSDDLFDRQNKAIRFMFNSVAGTAASHQKDWKAAIASFEAALVLNEDDAISHYRLGVAFLQDAPSQANDGFWEIGRSIGLNIPSTDQVKQFMHRRLVQYQQIACDASADEEIDQVLILAKASTNRPADFNVPSAQYVQALRNDRDDFLPWLQEGGEHGKTMWLATCGWEYPDLDVRVMDVTSADDGSVTLKVFYATTEEELRAATAPNMEVHVVGQSEATRIQKDDYVRFSGKLTTYKQSPFLLTWDMAKVMALLFYADNQATSR